MVNKIKNLDLVHRFGLTLELCRAGTCDYSLPPEPAVHVTQSWADILGYPLADIPEAQIFQSWWGQQIHPDDHARVINSFNQMYSGADEQLRCSFRIKHQSGSWREVEVSGCAISRDKKGWARHVFTVMRDLSHSESRYRTVLENLHDGLWVLDKTGSIRFINPSMAAMLGYSSEEILGKPVFNLQDEQTAAKYKKRISRKHKPSNEAFELELIHKKGVKVLVQVVSVPLFEGKRYDGVVETLKDITEQKNQQLRLKLLSSAVEQSGSMVLITNQDGDIEYVNRKFGEVTGYAKEEVLGENARLLRAEEIDAEQITDLWATITSGQDWHGELETRKKDGSKFWSYMTISAITDDKGQITNYVMVCEDVSQLKEARQKMEQLAYVDSLTGLANRVLFRDRLEQVLKVVQRSSSKAGLLYLDLDQFKRINDSLGHDVGDALLMKVAENLRQCVRHQDTVARMGGDEFVILLTDIEGVSGASAVARKILRSMARPVRLLKHEIIITPSIGITMAPDDSLNADILLKNADLAMYRAKSQGRNNYQFFTEEMNARVLDHLVIENELRSAIENDELLLNFQAQKSIETGELLGAEALIRWQHPEKGLVDPEYFIPIAETAGLMIPLGKWVLRKACREWRAMELAGMPALRLAVNLSTRQFRDPDLISSIQDILDETGFKPIQLELEITETTLMEHLDHAIGVLDKIKALGISISIDDFGTGYSSLNYLKRLPLDALKIDKTFIDDIPNDKDDMEIAAAVIAMAHKLNLKVIAEGVETQEQWDFLKANQCDMGQGFIVSKPILAEQFLKTFGKP
ncbi:MAG: EAL domain-containing protein [Gammaproteobacteria bacterium]|nr:EAL domain-containing protein [Gammaproteobacteria bacterium]